MSKRNSTTADLGTSQELEDEVKIVINEEQYSKIPVPSQENIISYLEEEEGSHDILDESLRDELERGWIGSLWRPIKGSFKIERYTRHPHLFLYNIEIR